MYTLVVNVNGIVSNFFKHAAWKYLPEFELNKLQSSVFKFGVLQPIDTEYHGPGIKILFLIESLNLLTDYFCCASLYFW